ncbi:MAG TPA: hypothetical protein VFT56_02935 [Sphingomonas sp.]|nr:hypothetical protein [Sphingomonas sp.]
MALLMMAALLATTQSPLPQPDGRYAVGVRRFELVDTSRKGVADDEPDQPRALPAIVWYPAQQSDAPPAPYFTKAEASVEVPALARNFLFEPAEVAGFYTARTHAVADAPPANGHAGFPVVVFSHGYWLYPNQNDGLFEQLASHGYVVVSIDHPRDSVDVKLADGRVVTTNPRSDTNKVLFALVHTLFTAPTDDERVAVLGRYAELFPASRMGVSLFAWRDDTLFAVQALRSGAVPAPVRAIMATANMNNLALSGMSYGGTTAATTCRLIVQCRAVLNLDGDNWEPALFNADAERPMLLIQSDWTTSPIVNGQPADPGFSAFDYGFEPWAQAGRTGHVQRVRIADVSHMGLTDLGLFMPGPKAAERFGKADPARVERIVNALSLAFLDVHLKHGDEAALDRVIEHTPGVFAHDPEHVRRWAASRSRR